MQQLCRHTVLLFHIVEVEVVEVHAGGFRWHCRSPPLGLVDQLLVQHADARCRRAVHEKKLGLREEGDMKYGWQQPNLEPLFEGAGGEIERLGDQPPACRPGKKTTIANPQGCSGTPKKGKNSPKVVKRPRSIGLLAQESTIAAVQRLRTIAHCP